ncbi:hypothetical protein ACQY0O_000363 [Thecaphora frezii]
MVISQDAALQQDIATPLDGAAEQPTESQGKTVSHRFRQSGSSQSRQSAQAAASA